MGSRHNGGVTPAVRLVLVHGTQLNAAQWHGYAALLGPDVELTAIDLPGHGTRMAEEFIWERALDAIDDAVAGARGKPVVLGGHSLGGYLAMAYAARHPDTLAALVPIGSSAIPRGPGATAYRLFARWSVRKGQERMAGRMDRAFRRFMTDHDHVEAMRAGGYALAGTPAAWEGVMASVRPGLLAEVTCPIVLINGQFDQLRVDARAFARAARRSPSVRIVTVARASHLLPMTHPDRTALELARVISALPAA